MKTFIMVITFIVLLFLALVFFGVSSHAAPPEAKREYFAVTVAGMATNHHTHVQVTGVVALVRHEGDGDTHIRLEDGQGHFITAECIPSLPCTAPKVGSTITVQGISRFDGEHKWWEVHPVEKLE